MAGQGKLAVLGFYGEEGGPAVKRQNPGAIGTSKWELPTWWDGASVCKLQHRVFNVANDLVVLLQKLLQLLDAVLQHWNLALKLRVEHKTYNLPSQYNTNIFERKRKERKSAGKSSTSQCLGMHRSCLFPFWPDTVIIFLSISWYWTN